MKIIGRIVLLSVGLILCAYIIDAQNDKSNKRFFHYDVNPGEGFNLRRDVFMRMAVMVKKLNLESKYHWTLVLPPWGPLYHWQSRELGDQIRIPWKAFFDVDSINRYVPVLDFEDYIKEHKQGHIIDLSCNLQDFEVMWENGEFKEKIEVEKCREHPIPFQEDENGNFASTFWQYDQVRTKRFQCVSVQGSTSVMRGFLENVAKDHKSIFLNRAERLLHDHFGDVEYWAVRRSMRFATALVEIANRFRQNELGSEPKNLSQKWETYRPERGSAQGGPYICAHLRRKDYVYSRKNQIPSLKHAAVQLTRKMQQYGVKTVFIATDAPMEEFKKLKEAFKDSDLKVVKYVPENKDKQKHKDGGVAIIEQSICSHAKYFIGSHESTFTFRIQEEREIMGFDIDKTFDMLCPDSEFDCKRGSVWKIVYPSQQRKHEEL